MKVNIVKVINGVGVGLGIVGTLFTGWAGQKIMKETIATQVVEEVAKQMNK